MWTAWVEIAHQRLAAGDEDGARLAALLANDDDVAECPFGDPVLVAGWNHAGQLRAAASARRTGPAKSWRPKAGRTQADYSAASGDFEL